jgi:hypothetical protein
VRRSTVCSGDARPARPPVGAAGHVYAVAPDTSFDRTSEQYREDCDDAWHRILDFVARR